MDLWRNQTEDSFTHITQIFKSKGTERVKGKGNDVTDLILSMLLAGIFLLIVTESPFQFCTICFKVKVNLMAKQK